jgi:hypothetical protein
MFSVGFRQHLGPLREPRLGEVKVHVVRGQHAQPAVMMLGVVPSEEVDAIRPGILERAEAHGKRGPVLEGLELRLGEGTVSPDARFVAADAVDRRGVRVWDLEENSFRVLESTKGKSLWDILFSATGRLFASDTEGNVWELDLRDDRCSLVTQMQLYYADLDPTGRLLVSCDMEGWVRVGPATGEEPHMLFAPAVCQNVAVDRNGRWVAGGSISSHAFLWRMPQGRPFQTLPRTDLLDSLRMSHGRAC